MGARVLAVAFGPELVTLITSSTDPPPDGARNRVFANHGPGFSERVTNRRRFVGGVAIAVELILGSRQRMSQRIRGIAVDVATFSRQLQLFQHVLRALGERVQPHCLRLGHSRRLRVRKRRKGCGELLERGSRHPHRERIRRA